MRLKKKLGAAVSAVALAGAATGIAIGVTESAGAATEAGGTWAAARPFPGFSASNAELSAAACPSLGQCVAVGNTYGGGMTPIVGSEVNGVWESSQVLSWPASLGSGSFGTFTDVSCGAPGDCTATGWYTGADKVTTAFYVSETGGAWEIPTAVTSPDQPTGTYSQVNGLSCPAVGYCTIVGRYTDQGVKNAGLTVSTPFILDEANGVWGTPQPVPGLASGSLGNLDSVSCVKASECTASGESGGNGFTGRPLVVTETEGGTWGSPEQLSSMLSTDHTVISCPDATDCTAAVTYVQDGYIEGIYAFDEADGVWGQPQLLNMPDVASNPLLGCRSAGNCVIVGNAHYSGTTSQVFDGPFVATEVSSGAWKTAAPPPGFQISTEVGGAADLSCVPDGDCTIAGTEQATSGGAESTWTAVSAPDGSMGPLRSLYQAVGNNAVQTLSCPQDGYCTLGFDVADQYMLGTEGTASAVALTASRPTVSYGDEQSETLTATASSAAGGTPTGAVTVTGPAGSTLCTITLAKGTVSSLGGTPTGWVTVRVDGHSVSGCTGLSLSAGTASCTGTTAILTAGPHEVTLFYGAHGNFAASTSAPLGLAVGVAGSWTGLTLSRSSVTYGSENLEKFTVSLSHFGSVRPTGKVQVRAGASTLCTVTLSNGAGSCTLTARQLRTGTWTIAAVYLGNVNYHSSKSAAKTLKVVA